MIEIPPCPPILRAIQHYLKIAQEHATRDPVVCYWSLLYALQSALLIDRKSDESKAFLIKMMDQLEVMKKEQKDNEAITNEVAAQAHIENHALKLFIWADSQDRASEFGKNVVKAFYTSGMLFDVLTTFGELTEEIQQNRKYAKWKAAYIHNCLKNGETPIPGPMQDGDDSKEENEDGNNVTDEGSLPPKQPSVESNESNNDFGLPQVPGNIPSAQQPDFPDVPSAGAPVPGFNPSPAPSGQFPPDFGAFSGPPSQPLPPSPASFMPVDTSATSASGGTHASLTPEQMTKAQKYCKWAGSALNYDDLPTAVMNLEKALRLLKTGVDG